MKDRYNELQISQQTIEKEQINIGHRLDDIKARKVK